jgi:hypothetical protein
MRGKGTLPLNSDPARVKVNSEYFIEHVLKPLPEANVPALYGSETHEVIRSSTSRFVQPFSKKPPNTRLTLGIDPI